MNANCFATASIRFPSPNRLRQFARLLFLAVALAISAPLLAASFTVNTGITDLDDAHAGDGTCADSNGKCSLRAAIDEANALAGGPHTITFSVPIVLVINGSLPTITAPVLMTGPATINGTGNAFSHGCLSFSDAASTNYPTGASNSKVIGLSIVNCSGDGITANGHGYTISGNFIGVDITGLIKMPNAGNGISMSASHVYNNVDTSSLSDLFATFPSLPVQQSDISTFVNNLATKLATLNPINITGNVISGNAGDGIYLHSENLGAVIVSNNMIGTDTTGNLAVANGGNGVHLNGNTFANLIGPNNVISGNAGNGIAVDGNNVVYLPNYIMGNRIGLSLANQAVHIGNAGNGISTDTSPDGSVTNKNPTGMSLVIGPANVISDNQGMASSDDPDTLSGEAAGVYITGSSNGVNVIGNTIGMAEFPAGTPIDSKNFGNAADGIIVTSTGNTIGGSSAGSGNIIAGNARHGIIVSTSSNTSTHILGNTIGLYPAFPNDMTLGNGYDGIHIDAASSTYVGGPGANDFNIVAANGRNGVKIRDGGLANGWANLVQRNQIYANAQGNPAALPSALPAGMGVGIDLDHIENASDGPHQEFPSTYANLDQAPAVICQGASGEPAACSGFTPAASSAGTTTLDWTLQTHGPATFRLEFFSLDSADDNTASRLTFLAEQTITTDSTGLPVGCTNGRCTSTISGSTAGAYISMNVTDVTPLVATPGNLGDWKNSLTCFIGDLGVILSACTVNDTSELSNVVAVPLSSNASLSNLAVSSGALSPTFASTTLSYSDAVANAVSSITLTPTLADTNASVKINGTSVASGSASAPITLAVGANTISVVVTAQDGSTTMTYTVTVNRAGTLSNNASLSNLAVSSGTLSPTFASTTLSYSDAVANAVSSITLTPTLADTNASVKVNGTSVTSGSASTPITLAVGANPISVVVTAQDGSTTMTYTVTVNRAGTLSNNASLSNLSVSSGTLSPSFAATTLGYADAVAHTVSSITITPTLADTNASVKVNGISVTNGSASTPITLTVGANTISVVVTAQDGSTTMTYTVTVNRAGTLSNNASLSNLSVSSGTFSPTFASTTLSYSDAVANAVSSITLTPTLADTNASVKVNGTSVTSGSASTPITLAVGANTVSVVVTAQDGSTTMTYTVTVNRAGALSNNASLSNLAVSSGTLSPSFAATTLGYADAVAHTVSSITITPTLADSSASVKINGSTVANGSASTPITLAVGANPISVVVTAQDGSTTMTYTVNINRAGSLSNNASLSNLAVSSGALSPSFASTTLTYSDAVANSVSSTTLTATLADSNASLKINGTAVTSGSASAPITLAVGATPISIVVTAQDGSTTMTYTVNVTRAAAVTTSFSGMAFTHTGIVTAALSGGGATCSFASTSLVGPPTAVPAGVTFPDGLFQFTATGCTGTITVTVTFPTAFEPSEQYWKYGPTSSSTSPHWYTLGAANSLTLSGHTATFTIADGGLGDDDLTVNGSIVDQGGPSFASSTGPIGGSGTAIAAPSITVWGMLLLAALLSLITMTDRHSTSRTMPTVIDRD